MTNDEGLTTNDESPNHLITQLPSHPTSVVAANSIKT